MQSGAIPDSYITASSMYDQNHSPARARLDMKIAGLLQAGWSPSSSVNQWLQVYFGNVTEVTHIATQGRYDSLSNRQWVTSYSLQYSSDGRSFANYEGGKSFQGNSDMNTVVKHALKPAIIARYIRVRPKTWNNYIAMRIELYGCKKGIEVY
jgi:hypothetical protein